MGSAGRYDSHHCIIPKEHRSNFYRFVAQCQVHLTCLRFLKIGAIINHTETNEYDIGTLPHIGGPFETASAFFEAWADCVRFDKSRDEIVRTMSTSATGRELCNEIADAVTSFPAQIKALIVSLPSTCPTSTMSVVSLWMKRFGRGGKSGDSILSYSRLRKMREAIIVTCC